MSAKRIIIPASFGLLLLVFLIITWATSATQVAAQCGSEPQPASSCVTCHILEDPVYDVGEWQCIHSRKDCCTNCHYCHPDDCPARTLIIATELGLTPDSVSTPTPVPQEKLWHIPW